MCAHDVFIFTTRVVPAKCAAQEHRHTRLNSEAAFNTANGETIIKYLNKPRSSPYLVKMIDTYLYETLHNTNDGLRGHMHAAVRGS